MTRYLKILILAFIAVWIWAAINPSYRHDWLLENYLVFIFVPIIIFTGRYFRLSDVSYTLITVFMILHVVGSHYTYAEVPFGDTLQRWMGSSRNMYDRLVHFSFGFLLAYPIREVCLRISKVKGFWGYYIPFDVVLVVLALSAVYEIIEWGAAANVDPAAGLAFLGSQGDVWDAQKDMTLAGSGAALAMMIIALINLRYQPGFWQELKSSFKIDTSDGPLGEKKLKEMRAARREMKG
jgi:putative membrane protein